MQRLLQFLRRFIRILTVKRNIFICNQNAKKSFNIRAEVVSLYRNKVWQLRLQKELYI